MNNDNRKIVKYDPNTGEPIYEEVKVEASEPVNQQPQQPNFQTPIVNDNSRFQPNNNFNNQQPVNQMNNQQQPMMNNYNQQPVMNQNNYQQPQYGQPMMNNYNQPMMNNYQPQNNLNQTSYQPSYDNKKSNKGLIIGIIVGIVVLIAVIAIGCLVFLNGKDSKKSDDNNTKPTTTINDYDDDDDDDNYDNDDDDDDDDVVIPSNSSYEISGHFKYNVYPGYSYSLDGSVLTVYYSSSNGFVIGELPTDELSEYLDTKDHFIEFLNEVGYVEVDNFEEYDDGDIYLLFCDVKNSSGYNFKLFITDVPGYYDEYYDYVIMGVMTENTANINTLAKYVKNVFSYAEEV